MTQQLRVKCSGHTVQEPEGGSQLPITATPGVRHLPLASMNAHMHAKPKHRHTKKAKQKLILSSKHNDKQSWLMNKNKSEVNDGLHKLRLGK